MPSLLLQRLASHAVPPIGSILWVGNTPVSDGEDTPFPDARLTALERIPGALDHPHEFDAIVISDGLEQDPWPRWALQRAHRCLRPGGILVLQTRRPGAIGTIADLAAMARRLTFSGRRFFHKRVHPGQPFPEVAPDTRLSDEELRATLESLHFQILEGPDQRGGAIRRVIARALPSLYEAHSESPFPDSERHRALHERALAADFVRRNAWAAKCPQWAPAHPQPLDPARWAGRTLIVLAPHPDDEIIGCGGTLLRAIEAGAKVVCIQASDGSAGAALAHEPEAVRVQRRLDEALEVGRRAGFEQVLMWREDNRHFAPGLERTEELARLLRQHDVAAVFVPFVTDVHPDHQSLARVLAAALESDPAAYGALEIAQYEIWSSVWPTHIVDVTQQASQIEELLSVYDTALRIDDYVHLCERRNYYNSTVHGGIAGHAEIFHLVPAREYPALLRSGQVS